MKKRIKIYKSKEEKEEFYQKFYSRLSMQTMLMNAEMWQEKEVKFPKNRLKMVSHQHSFSAS